MSGAWSGNLELPESLPWEQLRQAFDASAAVVAVFTGPDQRLVYQNPTSCRVLGERRPGIPAREAFPHSGDWVRALDHVRETGEVVRVGRAELALRTGRRTRPAAFDAVLSPLTGGGNRSAGVLVQAIEIPSDPAGGDHLHTALVLARASAELARSLDADQIAGTIVRLSAEAFSGWCLLDLWEPEGSLRRAAARHFDPARQGLLDRLLALPRVTSRLGSGESIAVTVARTGRVIAGRLDPDDLVAASVTAGHAEVLAGLRPGPHIIVPIQSGARSLGALSVLRGDTCPDFTRDDRLLAEQLAERAALALARAHDYDEQRQAVLTLQRAMLRPVPPALAGVEVAVRYRASGPGASIGGDWYDVFALDDGTLCIVVGDVEGHDLAAAAVMSQVRSVAHSHARAGLSPALVIEHANQFLCEQFDDHLVTMTVIQLHPAERIMVSARAGHIPSISATGKHTVVHDASGGLPLGVDASAQWHERTTHLASGAVTAVFTDGLVESPDHELGHGMALLGEVLANGASCDLEELADRIVVGLRGRRRAPSDDVALVLFRVPALLECSVHRVVRRLPPTAASVGITRHFLADLLPGWGLTRETVDVAALLSSELVTNAARHSDAVIELRITCEATLRIEVYDDNHRLPRLSTPDADEPSGRGLQIVAALACDWGVSVERGGKSVWFELPILTGDLPLDRQVSGASVPGSARRR